MVTCPIAFILAYLACEYTPFTRMLRTLTGIPERCFFSPPIVAAVIYGGVAGVVTISLERFLPKTLGKADG